jgi:hypothetical protein
MAGPTVRPSRALSGQPDSDADSAVADLIAQAFAAALARYEAEVETYRAPENLRYGVDDLASMSAARPFRSVTSQRLLILHRHW